MALTAIVRPDDVRKHNRRRVLTALRRGGRLSRTDIVRATGLSGATVSAIAATLLDEGVLATGPRGETAAVGRGRPKVALAVNPEAALVGAVTFHLNAVTAAVVDYAGETLGESAVAIATTGASRAAIRAALTRCLDDALEPLGRRRRRLRRIAVGVQGITDVAGTSLLWSPVTRPSDLPIKDWLEQSFGVPVHVSNDCDLMAQALNRRDPARYGATFGAVLLSYGVGMGLFLGGRLARGTRSSGMELGHMTHLPGGALCRCGQRGCIEAYAGDYAILRRARGEPESAPAFELVEDSALEAVAAAARAGEPRARAAIAEAGTALGTGLASLFALVDPFPVALIGKGATAFDLMEAPIRAALGETVAGSRADDIAIDVHPDEKPLVHEGCALSALTRLDDETAEAAPELVRS